ncbi:MAG: hypothetical protein IPM15_16785 [Betaproteobacteria bacterium]|nr:hypothetical protein [Betaproteobacteria bacterium]MCC6851091.1 hypothetical protein [Rubrivivax sp.]
MSVDNARVRKIIDHAIAHARAQGAGSGCDAYQQAWRNLKAWRDAPPAAGATPNSMDLEVAAAENYMYARASVCMGFVSRFQMNTMAIAYYATKVAGVAMPTSGNPQSAPDSGVLGWGGIGSQEGEADHARCNPNVEPPLWRPVNEVMPMSGSYGRALGTPGTRYAPPAP